MAKISAKSIKNQQTQRSIALPNEERLIERCRYFLRYDNDPREIGDCLAFLGADVFIAALAQISEPEQAWVLELLQLDGVELQ